MVWKELNHLVSCFDEDHKLTINHNIASFYEKHYGSANYLYVRGVTLATPLVGISITVYLITLGLYPPLPNSLFFLILE